MADFGFTPLLPLGEDTTQYRKISSEGVSTFEANGQTFLKVEPEAISELTRVAMGDIAHLLRTSHLAQLRAGLLRRSPGPRPTRRPRRRDLPSRVSSRARRSTLPAWSP